MEARCPRFIGFTEVSSMATTSSSSSSSSPSFPVDAKETELRLGLPGFPFPDRKHHQDVPGILLNLTRKSTSGAVMSQGCVSKAVIVKAIVVDIADRDEGSSESEKTNEYFRPDTRGGSMDTGYAIFFNDSAQVVGRHHNRSFHKNTAKGSEDVDGKLGAAGCLYVKVSMDGAPYMRKVDLGNYKNYAQLLVTLEQMFSCFSIKPGLCASKEPPGGEIRSERQLPDLLSSSDYILAYKDKDGDWMMVGDVPWRMFAESCRRMRIMKVY